jgi:hypothetical protein
MLPALYRNNLGGLMRFLTRMAYLAIVFLLPVSLEAGQMAYRANSETHGVQDICHTRTSGMKVHTNGIVPDKSGNPRA